MEALAETARRGGEGRPYLCPRAHSIAGFLHRGSLSVLQVTKLTDCKLPDGRVERLVVAIKGSFLVVALIDTDGSTLGTAVKDFKHIALTGADGDRGNGCRSAREVRGL